MAQALSTMGLGRLGAAEVLEPGCGTGTLMGAIEAAGIDAHVTGVELDPLSARVCSALHPTQTVVNAGLEDCLIPEGSFDAVIGNVPYSDAITLPEGDDRYPIHDWFVRAAVRAVRPGGVVCLLTSRFTLDKQDPRTRAWLCERAELSCALRLPAETFAEAGTSVVSDLLVLRRRPELVRGADAEWVHTTTLSGVRVSSAMVGGAGRVIGRMGVGMGRFGSELQVTSGLTPYEVGSLAAEGLEAQIASASLSGCLASAPERMAEPSCLVRPHAAAPFEYMVDDAGNVWYGDERSVAPVVTRVASDAERLSGMVVLRDRLRQTLELEGTDAPDALVDDSIARLRSDYEAFVARHGRLCDVRNRRAWASESDYSGALTRSLEVVDARGRFVREADALRVRVRTPTARPPEHVEDPVDAIAVSVAQTGRVDLALVAGLLGCDESHVLDELGGLAVRDPETGQVVTADAYLSGDVGHRLERVRALLAQAEDGGRSGAEALWREGLGMPQTLVPDDGDARRVESMVELLRASGAWAELLDPDAAQTVTPVGASMLQLTVDWSNRSCYPSLLARVLAEGARPMGLAGEARPSDMCAGLLGPAMRQCWAREGLAPAGLSILSELVRSPADRVSDEAVAAALLCGIEARWGHRSWRYGYGDTSEKPTLAGPLAGVATLMPDLAEPLAAMYASLRNGTWDVVPSEIKEAGRSESMRREDLAPALELARRLRRSPEVIEYLFECASLGQDVTMDGLVEFRRRRAAFVEANRAQDPSLPDAGGLRALEARLAAVRPERLGPSEVSMALGSAWIPPRYVLMFASEVLGIGEAGPSPAKRRGVHVGYSAETGRWSVRAPGGAVGRDGAEEFGTADVSVTKVLEAALNNSPIRVTRDDPDNPGRRVPDPVASAQAQVRRREVAQAWDRWLMENPRVAERLADVYHERVNVMVSRTFDGSRLTFPGMSAQVRLRDHQRDAVARVLGSDEGTLIAHCVGAGKTFEGIASVMEARRLGRCSKALVAVPNSLCEQWAADFLTLYPTARVIYMTEADMRSADTVRAFWARVATGSWDAVIVGHSRFSQLGVSPGRQEAGLERRSRELARSILTAKELNGAGDFTVKQLEAVRQRVKGRMEALRERESLPGITFEELGVDFLLVDEAHNFKNLAIDTALSVAGMTNAASQKCEDLLDKCDYLRDTGHGSNIVFATGTPVSNTMSELYNLERYLAPRLLEAQGVSVFSAWATTFGEIVDSVEVRPEGGGYQVKQRFSRFRNLPELMSSFHAFADVITQEDIDLDVPEREYVNVRLSPSDSQRAAMAELVERAGRIRAGGVPPAADNMLKVTSDGRKLAVDPKLLHPGDEGWAPMEAGKAQACAERVAEVWRETEGVRGTQLVFCDTSTPAGGRWNAVDDLRARIVAAGVPAGEVATVYMAGGNARRRQELFDSVDDGVVRVLIGSTQTLGTGVNVQTHLVATHDLDCPWRPSDLQQREGRIVRQGNGNERVRIFRYVVEGTQDAFMYQTCETKQRFIGQVFTNRSPLREASDIDEVSIDYATLKALATGDPTIKERMELKSRLDQLTLLRAAWAGDNRRRRESIDLSKRPLLEAARERLARREADGPAFAAAARALGEAGEAFPLTVSGIPYATRQQAADALLSAAERAMPGPKGSPAKIGELCGIDVLCLFNDADHSGAYVRSLALSSGGVWPSRKALPKAGATACAQLERIVNGFAAETERLRDEVPRLEADLERAEAACSAAWDGQEEYDSVSRRLEELGDPLEEGAGHTEAPVEHGPTFDCIALPCDASRQPAPTTLPATDDAIADALGGAWLAIPLCEIGRGLEVVALVADSGTALSPSTAHRRVIPEIASETDGLELLRDALVVARDAKSGRIVDLPDEFGERLRESGTEAVANGRRVAW